MVVFAALAGCKPNYSPDSYNSAAVQQANKVEQGVIVGVRAVAVTASGVAGAAAGGAAGGIIGSQAGPGGVTGALGAVGGSLIGGIVGTGVEHAQGDTTAWEYVVKEGKGDLVSVTQKDDKPLAIGQKVLVIAGNQARIVPDYTVTPEPPPAPTVTEPPPATVTATPLAPPSAPPPAASAASSPAASPGPAPPAAAPPSTSPPANLSPTFLLPTPVLPPAGPAVAKPDAAAHVPG